MNQPNNNVTPLPSIADVYERIHGELLEGEGDERRGYCLSAKHKDGNPSCDYNIQKDVFHCKSCDISGGVISLVIDSGRAADRKMAAKWLRDNGLLAKRKSQSVWETADARYPYTDAEGVLVYEVGRWNLPDGGKQFRQHAPDGKGDWKEGKGALTGITRVPYRLLELMAARNAIATGSERALFVVEGEKDADTLGRHDLLATTNAQGARWEWPVSWAEYFVGFDVVYVLADNDDEGRKAAQKRAQLIATVVPVVKVVYALPGVGDKGDVSDWFARGGTSAQLLAICENGEVAEPYVPSYNVDAVAELVSDHTDLAAGHWFNAHYGDVTRFIKEAKAWYVYGGGVWELDGSAAGKFGIQAAKLARFAAADYDGPDADEFVKHGEALGGLSKRKAMIESASYENQSPMAVFDAHPTLFNCSNGTLDLVTGELHEHAHADMLTLQTPVVFDANAKCPTFERWLDECVGSDQALFDYMQMVMGSCLEARAGLRCFYFIFGPKGTGKSTFVRMLEALLGPYQTATDFNALCESRFGNDGSGATPQLAALRAKRMVSAAEARGDAKLDAARIKQLVGGDKVTARFLHQNPFDFRFEATLIMSGNEMPRIVGDESIWDKFKPVPFLREIAAEDPDFEERELLPELSGILNFALEGLTKLRRAGYKMVEPQAVIDARNTERAEQDTFKDFVAEHIMKAGSARVPGTAVCTLYGKWASRTGSPKLNPQQVKVAMVRHGFESVMPKNVRHWKDIKLIDPDGAAATPF